MLEAYQAFTDFNGMMDLTEDMIRTVAHKVLGTGKVDVYKRQVKILAVSLSSIKQYYDEKYDRGNFIKNVILDNILSLIPL